jgi:hypothetical protein
MQRKTFFRRRADGAELASASRARYASWLRACESVSASYRDYGAASRSDREVAYATYLATLDREEDTARAYQELVEQTQASSAGWLSAWSCDEPPWS